MWGDGDGVAGFGGERCEALRLSCRCILYSLRFESQPSDLQSSEIIRLCVRMGGLDTVSLSYSKP